MKVIYRYFAIKPISAEHPVGSGTIVKYESGMEVPANEWGRATANLVEMGKIARVAFNVEDDDNGTSLAVGIQPDCPPEKPEKRPVGRPRKRQV